MNPRAVHPVSLRAAAAGFLVFAACATADMAYARASSAPVARGEYIAVMGDCVACHTRAGGDPYAGGYALHARFGTVYSSNITPDKATGIGSWTAQQFYNAFHEGIAPDNRHLYPAFPYPYFTHTSRADAEALFAYLKSLKPVVYRPPPDKLIFPANIREMMVFWNLLFLDRTPSRPDPEKSAAWNRGSQIVNGVGHCGACHTPKNFFFADRPHMAFQGDLIDGWFASNLTGTPVDGLAAWTVADIVQYLKTGSNRRARVVGSMKDVVRLSTSRLSDQDISAIAVYLKSLPAAREKRAAPTEPNAMRSGEVIFAQRCSSCHLESSAGALPAYPVLADNSLVLARDPSTVMRVVLQGSQSVATANGPIGFSMPAFPFLTDNELADVTTFIRNSWGNKAGAVSSSAAANFRKLVAPTD